MSTTSVFRLLRDGLRAFRSARSGNVTLTFALAAIPVIGLIGAAVDYTRANSAKASMQAALDAAALSLSKEAQALNAAQLNLKADLYFKANFNRPDAKNIIITPTFSDLGNGSYKLNLAGKATIDTTITGIWQDKLNIGGDSHVIWGMKRLELALVLDNTGSMARGGKILQLKKAVNDLLDTLKKAAKKPDDVKVAIIPFDTTVRLDQDHKSPASWVSFNDFDKEKSTWIGCVKDRDQPSDALDTTPAAGNSSTLFPAAACSNSGALVKMLPLTNDWNALRLRVLQMNPNGNTNITIGLVWGWHALTPNLPFSEAATPQPDLDKVIILLTDGQNTQNRWSTSSSTIDRRTKAACDNIKAANIKLYTIRVIDGNSSLLSQCATNPAMYYDVQDAGQLISVFQQIAQNLANLRIAK